MPDPYGSRFRTETHAEPPKGPGGECAGAVGCLVLFLVGSWLFRKARVWRQEYLRAAPEREEKRRRAAEARRERVERRREWLRLERERRRKEGAEQKKDGGVAGLSRWYQEQKALIERSVADDNQRETALSKLLERYNDLLTDKIEGMDP
jgi:hypothetical protein